MRKLTLTILLLATLALASSYGGVRRFTFLYEANTSARGSLELENWVTWKGADGHDGFDQVEFRHELEYGVTDKFQASLYFADWAYENDSEHSGFTYQGGGLELIYNFTNPVIDPVGMSAYGELKVGEELIELESKFIAQKNFGPIILAYNAILEAEWEGRDLEEKAGEFSQAFGVSYEFSPRFSAGIEFLHEFVFPEWKDTEEIRNFFVGPNICYRHGQWFVTMTALAQATDTADEPDFQFRTILGVGL